MPSDIIYVAEYNALGNEINVRRFRFDAVKRRIMKPDGLTEKEIDVEETPKETPLFERPVSKFPSLSRHFYRFVDCGRVLPEGLPSTKRKSDGSL